MQNGASLSVIGAANPYRYTGATFDSATGLYFLRARFYDPQAGRFLSQDPFAGSEEVPHTLHKYLYTGNDPVNFTDPTGQFEFGDVLSALGAALNFTARVVTNRLVVAFLAVAFNPSPANAPGPNDHLYADHSDRSIMQFLLFQEVGGRAIGYFGGKFLKFCAILAYRTFLSAFEDGGSWIMTAEQYEKYIAGQPFAGRADGQFISPSADIDKVIAETGGDTISLAKRLSTEWQPGQKLVCIDVRDVMKYNLRLPTANLSGANSKFIAGRKLLEGFPKSLLTQFQLLILS
ncbi:MAG: RHS repeat-associated core domain-containing protein [Chthonomonadaceae bacterium]|nr:RHS repeat-associated core domain-containing protein [Chthonomonadaceae bacterium]